MINAHARALGLDDTHYSTPIGLDDAGNYSSASDLARLAARDDQLRRDVAGAEFGVGRELVGERATRGVVEALVGEVDERLQRRAGRQRRDRDGVLRRDRLRSATQRPMWLKTVVAKSPT